MRKEDIIMNKKFHLVIDEPITVAYGKVGDNAWGHVQFPTLYATVNGKILAFRNG